MPPDIDSVQPVALPLAGLSVAITGTLSTLSREQASALIRAAGAKVVGGVSSKTSYLVVGEAPGGGGAGVATVLPASSAALQVTASRHSKQRASLQPRRPISDVILFMAVPFL